MYMSICKAPDGVKIMHGNRGYFHADKQPVFSSTYRIIEQYQLGTDLFRNFLMPLESALADDFVVESNCGKAADKLLFVPKQIFKETDYYYNSS